ncbi:MAG: hypothetical protein HY673_14540 [Chloroflexi bacterium]|nr:hypothetical protein [Chloroflexota bacterium]
MNKARIVIGSPARGLDLWDREDVIREIWSALERDNVLLVAPRRFGKTSIMLNLRDEPRDHFKVFYFDTEWMKGPEYFIAEVAAELAADSDLKQFLSRSGGTLRGVMERLGEIQLSEFKLKFKEETARNWQEKGRELILQVSGHKGKILLVVDELPLMIQRMSGEDKNVTRDFLHWMRSLRQMPEPGNLRFVIGGSIGIEHVLKHLGTDTKVISDLRRIKVDPFSHDQCRDFIRVLLSNEANLQDVSAALLQAFVDVLQTPVPHFVQILVAEAIREAEKQGRQLSPEIIHKAYSERVLASYNRTYFEHYYARLRDYYAEEQGPAKALLLGMAKRGEMTRSELWNAYQVARGGGGSEDDFGYLLFDLENDFYIQYSVADGVYRFATKVLRDWWLRYYSVVK